MSPSYTIVMPIEAVMNPQFVGIVPCSTLSVHIQYDWYVQGRWRQVRPIAAVLDVFSFYNAGYCFRSPCSQIPYLSSKYNKPAIACIYCKRCARYNTLTVTVISDFMITILKFCIAIGGFSWNVCIVQEIHTLFRVILYKREYNGFRSWGRVFYRTAFCSLNDYSLQIISGREVFS